MAFLDRVLDATVVRSFDAAGFQRHSRRFDPSDLDVDLSHRNMVITGANSGLGYAAAEELGRRGARLWLLCRSEARAREAAESLVARTGNPHIVVVPCDLSDPRSVDAAAEHPSLPLRLDVLVHNAGVLPLERTVLPTGLELTLATNLVGPHRLTARLLPRLWHSAQETRDARIVHVSSGGMYTQKLDVGELANTQGSFDGAVAYARTKRAQVVLTELLAARWRGRGLRVSAMHPGWADTPGVRSSLPGFFRVMKGALRTPAQGADTTVWLAGSRTPPVPDGAFWFDRESVSPYLLPRTREAAEERERLWRRLNEWAGTTDQDFRSPRA